VNVWTNLVTCANSQRESENPPVSRKSTIHVMTGNQSLVESYADLYTGTQLN
jgi:hypothetical protein